MVVSWRLSCIIYLYQKIQKVQNPSRLCGRLSTVFCPRTYCIHTRTCTHTHVHTHTKLIWGRDWMFAQPQIAMFSDRILISGINNFWSLPKEILIKINRFTQPPQDIQKQGSYWSVSLSEAADAKHNYSNIVSLYWTTILFINILAQDKLQYFPLYWTISLSSQTGKLNGFPDVLLTKMCVPSGH